MPLPGPSMQALPSQSVTAPSTTAQEPKPTAIPTTGVAKSKAKSVAETKAKLTQLKPKPLVIPPSPVVQIDIPSEHKLMVIESPVAQMPTKCDVEIDAPRDNRRRGVFQCGDFAAAGTNSTGTTLLVGHSSVNQVWHTVFDKLSCTATSCASTTVAQGCSLQKKARLGQIIYIQTEKSRKIGRWLEYRITGVYCPSKDVGKDLDIKGLVYDSTPGQLSLATCLEPINGESINNLMVVAKFIGVK